MKYQLYKSYKTDNLFIEKYNKKRKSYYKIFIGFYEKDYPYFIVKQEAFNYLKNNNIIYPITFDEIIKYIEEETFSSDKNKIIKLIKKIINK